MGCCTSKEWVPDPVARPGVAPGKWTHIAWSGGAARGVVCVGAYRALWEYGVIHELQGAAGTSVGSLFALTTVMRVQPPTLEQDIIALDTAKFADGSIWRLFCGHLGLHRGQYLERWCNRFIERHVGIRNCTFAQLYAHTGRELRICVWNETQARVEFWDHHSHPDLRVSRAVRASTSMPGYFEPVRLGSDLIVDGGVGNVLPTDAFGNKTTLGVMLLARSEHATAKLVTHQPVHSLRDHFEAVYEGFVASQFRLQHDASWVADTIALRCPDKPQWDIALTADEKAEWFRTSYQNARDEIFRLQFVDKK